ncbi:metallophosphoesterase family protein [Photobacterium satsumensis]|uniref:metallophosphoesterase family protein n=1 Tax=Photobacterium satsumensis TaxID=2910239 RepID=UPI003D148F00
MKIYQITDTHLAEMPNESDTNLQKLLDIVNQDTDDNVLLLTGDLANAAVPAAYDRIKSYLEARDNITQCYALAGNHDDLSCMKASFRHSKIRIVQSATVHGIPLHFLDTSHKPLGTSLELGAGRVSRKGLAALKKIARKSPTLIISHHPLLDVSQRWFKHIGIENQDLLIRLFKSKQTVISGHAHYYFDIEEGYIRQLVGISSSYGFEHQSDIPHRTGIVGMTVYQAERLNGEIDVRLVENYPLSSQ